MKSTASKIRLTYDESGKPELTLSLNCSRQEAAAEVAELREVLAKGKLLDVEVKQHRNRRSLDANALLWKMCTEIANVIRSSKDEVYLQMLERYGVFTHIIVKQEAVERIKKEWRTVRVLGEVAVNGKTGIQLQCYYGSHLYDSKEFSILLDGVISEARELGIEVISEREKSLLLQEWGKGT
jgi:hypothetical protein